MKSGGGYLAVDEPEKSRVSGGTLSSPGCRPQGKAGVHEPQKGSRVAVTLWALWEMNSKTI